MMYRNEDVYQGVEIAYANLKLKVKARPEFAHRTYEAVQAAELEEWIFAKLPEEEELKLGQ